MVGIFMRGRMAGSAYVTTGNLSPNVQPPSIGEDMRLIAISIFVLSGAIMASAGTIAESLPGAKRVSIVDGCGLAVVAIGGLLFIVELFTLSPFSSANSRLSPESRVGP
jgi:hypothetical protein